MYLTFILILKNALFYPLRLVNNYYRLVSFRGGFYLVSQNVFNFSWISTTLIEIVDLEDEIFGSIKNSDRANSNSSKLYFTLKNIIFTVFFFFFPIIIYFDGRILALIITNKSSKDVL